MTWKAFLIGHWLEMGISPKLLAIHFLPGPERVRRCSPLSLLLLSSCLMITTFSIIPVRELRISKTQLRISYF